MLLPDAVQGWVDDVGTELPTERQAFARSLAERLRTSPHARVAVEGLHPDDVGAIAATFLEHERDEVGAVLHAARAWARTPSAGPISGPTAPGPGWWQASDDNWYPPEDHPDVRAEAPVVPPAPPAGVRVTGSRSAGRTRGLLIGAAVAVTVAAGAIVALASASSERSTNVEPVTASTPIPDPSPAPTPLPTSATDEAVTTAGTRADPFAIDMPTLIRFETFGDADGSIWEVTIGATADITQRVIDANEYNDPPPDGVRFVGFPVRMTLLDGATEPLAPDFTLTWNIIGGATNAVYDSTTISTESYGCGVVPDAFETFAATAIGGTLDGTICIPVPEEDVAHPGTMSGFEISGDRHVAFSPSGTATSGVQRPSASFGDRFPTTPGSLGDPHAYGETVDVLVEGYSDAVGSRWEITVEAPRDITEFVLAENEFNDAPPDGVRFVGVDIMMRLADATEEPLEPGSGASWEIIGGSTLLVYEQYVDLTGITGCGVVPDEFDTFDEVFEGGTVSGTLCMPLPAADLDDPATRVALYWTGSSTRIGWGPPN